MSSRRWDEIYNRALGQYPKLKIVTHQLRLGYTTTIGYTIFMDPGDVGWNCETLRHELVHVEQYHRWGLWFWFSYLFVLPCLFSMRAYWELQAYKESIRARREYGLSLDIEEYVNEFTGAGYFWMFPFPKIIRRLLENPP